MNIKRALGFGALMWIFIFVLWSIIIFIPALQDKETTQFVVYWVLLIPVVLLTAKWYFKADPPTLKKGILLGIIALVVGSILDAIITVPLFIEGNYGEFFLNKLMYIGYAWFLILTAYAGYEFDGTFTKPKVEQEDKKGAK